MWPSLTALPQATVRLSHFLKLCFRKSTISKARLLALQLDAKIIVIILVYPTFPKVLFATLCPTLQKALTLYFFLLYSLFCPYKLFVSHASVGKRRKPWMKIKWCVPNSLLAERRLQALDAVMLFHSIFLNSRVARSLWTFDPQDNLDTAYKLL